jgi:hypothetical protein
MSSTLTELRLALNDLRRARATFQHYNKWILTYPEHLSEEAELHLIDLIHKIEKDPPSGPEILMLFAEAANKYEERLIKTSNIVVKESNSVVALTNQLKSVKNWAIAIVGVQALLLVANVLFTVLH